MTSSFALALVLSYFCGAIPFGLIVAKLRGIDIRAVGSGNIGTTNVWRTLGPVAGTAVFALDVLKGLSAPLLARAIMSHNSYWEIAACAGLAILGHTFSVFLKFKGGKGIATGFGAMLGIVPFVAIGCFVLWGIALGLSRMISVASIVACIATPIGLFLTKAPLPYGAVVTLLTLVALIKHVPNMKRIMLGTEPRIGSSKNNSQEMEEKTNEEATGERGRHSAVTGS